jgi:NitT/TauT family transport system permease protein
VAAKARHRLAAKARHRLADYLLLAATLLVAWQIVSMLAGGTTISSPWSAFGTAAELVTSEDFLPNFLSTMRAFLIATIIAVAGGTFIGLALGANRLLGDAYEPMLMSFYTVPKVAFFPVILLVFGIGLSAQVAFGVIHGIVPVAIFTINAVRNIRRVFIKTASALGLSRSQTALTVLLPAIAPEVFAGARMGISLTFIGVILSEMFGSKQGIGFLLMQAIGLSNGSLIMALTTLIVAFALSLNGALAWLNRRLDYQTAARFVEQ